MTDAKNLSMLLMALPPADYDLFAKAAEAPFIKEIEGLNIVTNDVAMATQEGSTLLVKGLDAGTTDIEVTDTLTNQSKYIHVTVFFVPMFTCSNDNHPHIIDLGLPSGTQWSCCNRGAENPEARGGYYAWGETVAKESYDWSTYIHC